MIFNPLIHKSITFATKVHHTQTRKGKDIPYITHPLTVALILSRATHNENIICAGILHDTIEDCVPYGSVTKDFLEKEFNGKIAQMVNDLTEQDKTLPWMERKKAALEQLAMGCFKQNFQITRRHHTTLLSGKGLQNKQDICTYFHLNGKYNS